MRIQERLYDSPRWAHVKVSRNQTGGISIFYRVPKDKKKSERESISDYFSQVMREEGFDEE